MMKKASWLSWAIAIILVGSAGYSAFYVHQAEKKNAVKVERQAKLDRKEKKQQRKLLQEQKKHMRTPISWERSSETLPYPDVSQALKAKKLDQKIWLLVSPSKQRVYVRQGPYTLYTMYASIGKNFEGVKNYQETPTGEFKLQKERGSEFYDATKGYGAKYWTAFHGHGAYRFESVPFDQAGQVIESKAQQLGKKVTKKHNVQAYGSIRLSVADAKWIMETLPAKTKVFIEDNEPKHDAWEYLKD